MVVASIFGLIWKVEQASSLFAQYTAEMAVLLACFRICSRSCCDILANSTGFCSNSAMVVALSSKMLQHRSI